MKGILFRTWQTKLQALEEFGQAQTRRVIKPQPVKEHNFWQWGMTRHKDTPIPLCLGIDERQLAECLTKYARYQVGEVVYVKEAWYAEKRFDHLMPRDIPHLSLIGYPTEDTDLLHTPIWAGRLRSPLFLPEHFARDFVLMLEVKPQRVQEITPGDALREGIIIERHRYCIVYRSRSNHGGEGFASPERAYSNLWNSINPEHPFEMNPWEMTYTFERKLVADIPGRISQKAIVEQCQE